MMLHNHNTSGVKSMICDYVVMVFNHGLYVARVPNLIMFQIDESPDDQIRLHCSSSLSSFLESVECNIAVL